MRRTTMAAAATMAGATIAAGLIGTASAQARPASSTYEGCRAGYVCIYPQGKGWNGGHPSYSTETYGYHNLSGEYGTHRVFNNQTGGASVTLNKGYNGANPVFDINAFSYSDYNLTPINSITLVS